MRAYSRSPGQSGQLLTEVLGTLTIDDPTVRIAILDRISALMGGANRVRALVAQRRKELLGKERVAAVIAAVDRLERLADIRELTSLLTR